MEVSPLTRDADLYKMLGADQVRHSPLVAGVKNHEVLVNAVRELRPSVNQLVTVVGQELQVGERLGPRR
jgi:hypothetical protein